MYKTLSANMINRRNRSCKAGGMKKVYEAKDGSLRWGAPRHIKIKKARANTSLTEADLVLKLGRGDRFVKMVYGRYGKELRTLNYEPKRCSAYLNIVAGVRMLDGSRWTDQAVASMMRRVLDSKC